MTNKPRANVFMLTNATHDTMAVMTDRADRASTSTTVVSFPENGSHCGFKRIFIADPPFFALMPPADSIFGGK